MGVLRARVADSWVDMATTGPQGPMGYVGRNLLDNGQMAVKQRSVMNSALPGPSFLSDRWAVNNSGIGNATLTYATLAAFGATGIPVGRPRPANIQYIIMTTAEAAGSLTPADYFQWSQCIEGQNLQHFNWGSPDAQAVTFSFDIYSSIATSYIVEIYKLETTVRSISRLLTVPSGWSTQVVSVPGDTGAAITNDNAARLQVSIAIAGGSTYTSGGVLQTTWGNMVSGNRWVGISNAFQAAINNVFAITNAQFEVGSQATPYEVRKWSDELRACQRYFTRIDSTGNVYTPFASGQCFSATAAATYTVLPVPMRAIPVVTYSAGATFMVHASNGAAVVVTGVTDSNKSNRFFRTDITVAAGLVAGNGTTLFSNNSLLTTIDANAEI